MLTVTIQAITKTNSKVIQSRQVAIEAGSVQKAIKEILGDIQSKYDIVSYKRID